MLTIIERQEEKEKTQPKLTMHSMQLLPHHLLSDVQPLSPSSNWFLLAISPQFIYWPWCCMVWNVPLASLGHLPQLCSFPAFRAPPHWQSMRHWKVLGSLFSNSQTISVFSTLFSTEPKTVPAAEKRINSIPAQTRTGLQYAQCHPRRAGQPELLGGGHQQRELMEAWNCAWLGCCLQMPHSYLCVFLGRRSGQWLSHFSWCVCQGWRSC